jgi:hypothetical protein
MITTTRTQYAITVEIAESPDGYDHSQNEPMVRKAAENLTERLCGRNVTFSVVCDGTTLYEETIPDD